ncbi:phage tail terminator protein [Vibrio quintilis]|uniref:Uncharacterized protein n=1 Tax=Vibrio quintilis TaxID=1117707 RepID=A0A1M7Z1G9_9VIBR|nr:hypothetical protein [Vibrio quintilis]SHO58797.1 hypothetical protein VQ7734_04569 [Vibrio quintilis]
MSIVQAVINRLKTTPKPWVDVKALGALTQLDMAKSGTRTPTLYVFQTGETTGGGVPGSGPYLQTVRPTIGIVIVERSVNGKEIDFEPLRAQLKQRLFGWSPLPQHEPFWLGGGRLLSVHTATASWMDNFVTEYTEDQNRYGA